ncbi:MAG: ArsR/SmtB family transcription factor [Candidatus Saccharimonadales bacterium]
MFGSLADPTRRDILKRVARSELTVSEIANSYDISLAAVSKHLKILEKARLVVKRRKGRQQFVSLSPGSIADATEYLDWYRKFMGVKLDSLDNYLSKEA